MKSIKEVLIGTMQNGQNVLNSISVSQKIGADFSLDIDSTSRTIEQLHAKKLELKVVDIFNVTKDSKTIRFASKTGYLPPFEAGQYINIFVEIDGVRTSRPYSISSSPRQRAYYEITVARISKGFVSDYFFDKVKVGDEFEGNGAQGVFHYNPIFHSKKSVFLAGGSGITPFMSMTREIFEMDLDREIYLIYGVRNEESAMFKAELEKMAATHKNFHLNFVVSDKAAETNSRRGFIDQVCIKEIVGELFDKTYYICGPQIMNDFCVQALLALNVKPKNIRREMFGARADIQNEPGFPSNLTGNEVFKIKVGDKSIDARANESVLCALERAGIRVNVCCRSGECSLCKVKLISGKVFTARGVLLRHADEVFGYIHSCKAYPISDIEIML
ncbi:MAG: iron-sulfur cluster-binding domain-containing protein [Clostridia bacterium]